MNEFGKSKVSLLPLLLIIGLIVGAGYLLVRGEVKIPGADEEKNVEIRRLEGFPTTIETTEVVDKQRSVIKSEEELQAFFDLIDKTGKLSLDESIDFNKEYLIGVSTKTLDESDQTIKIKKIYEVKETGSLLVSNLQTKPGDTCRPGNVTYIAVDLVAISKFDKNIEFELLKETEECEESSLDDTEEESSASESEGSTTDDLETIDNNVNNVSE